MTFFQRSSWYDHVILNKSEFGGKILRRLTREINLYLGIPGPKWNLAQKSLEIIRWLKYHFNEILFWCRIPYNKKNALETRENGNDFNDSSIWTIFDGPILSNREFRNSFKGLKSHFSFGLLMLNFDRLVTNIIDPLANVTDKSCVHFYQFLCWRVFWLFFVWIFAGSGPEITVSEYVTYCMCIMHPSLLEAYNLKLLLWHGLISCLRYFA